MEDSVSVFEAQRVTRRFREVEIELLDGDERTLQRLARSLRKAGAQRGVFKPKLYQALDLEFDRETRTLGVDAAPGEALGVALVEQHRKLLDHDPGTRLGADAEDLHQMRVATRRARAFLRAARELLEPVWAEGLRAELGWLGSALGPARDADVLLEHVRAEVEALGKDAKPLRALVSSLEAERETARGAAVAALSESRYFDFSLAAEQAGDPPLVPEASSSLAELWWADDPTLKHGLERTDPARETSRDSRSRRDGESARPPR